MENIDIALQLLVVGMVTVFIILLIVIYLSKLLIYAVNKLAPSESVHPTKTAATPATVHAVSPHTQRIIEAAVAQITAGKGRVSSIKEAK